MKTQQKINMRDHAYILYDHCFSGIVNMSSVRAMVINTFKHGTQRSIKGVSNLIRIVVRDAGSCDIWCYVWIDITKLLPPKSVWFFNFTALTLLHLKGIHAAEPILYTIIKLCCYVIRSTRSPEWIPRPRSWPQVSPGCGLPKGDLVDRIT